MAKIIFPEYLHKFADPVRGYESDELLHISQSETKFKKSSNEYTDRPTGRDDWQIIYLSGGYGTYQYGEDVIKLGPSVMIVFKPFEPQHYAYYGCECPEAINYVHFSGTSASELLRRFGFDDKPYYYMRPSGDQSIISLFLKMQLRMRMHPEDNHMCWSVFFDLLTSLSKNRIDDKQNIEIDNAGKYTDAITKVLWGMHSNPASKSQVKDYAEQLHLSPSRFAHIFKSLTGVSPIEYKNNLRIENAKNMLINTNANIEEIGFEVGYDNLANFSKAFKNKTGLSPMQYRNRPNKNSKGQS